ncbi:MAG: hypothetical protein ACRDQ0_03410, partial [Pseudonocardia sp.]
AQEATAPTLDGADVVITMADGAQDTVRSTFRLAAPLGTDTVVPHLLFDRAGVELIEARTGSGTTLQRTADSRLAVALPAGTQEYVVEHSVRREAGTRTVPLVVPEIDTARRAAVQITLTLPDGQRLVGDSMPTFQEITPNEVDADGGAVTVRHTGGALPSVVVSGHGTGPELTTGTVLSVVGIGFLALVVVLWFRHTSREQESRA